MIQSNINQMISLASLVAGNLPVVQEAAARATEARAIKREEKSISAKKEALAAYDKTKAESEAILKNPNATEQQKEAARDTLEGIAEVRRKEVIEPTTALERRKYQLNPTAASAEGIVDEAIGEVVEKNEAARDERKAKKEMDAAEARRIANEKAMAKQEEIRATRAAIRGNILAGSPLGPIRKEN